MNESVVPVPPLPVDASELPEHRRHPVSILVFGSVIVVVQIIDFILGDRVSNIVNAAASGSERLIRILSLGGDALFLVVLAFGVGHAAHHHSRLAKGDEKGFPPVLLVAYLVIATINVLQNMVILVVTPTLQNASQTGLIIDLGLLFASNMLIFSLWYMLADAYLTGGAFDFPPRCITPRRPASVG